MLSKIYNSFLFRLVLVIVSTGSATKFFLEKDWLLFTVSLWGLLFSANLMRLLYKRNAEKVAFMFDAIDNSDFAFKYAIRGISSNDKLVNKSLNRITQILFQAKAEAVQKEKYYELIMNSVNTGIIVLDDNGYIYQTNNEALRLLGLTVFTHVKQLEHIEHSLEETIRTIQPGHKHQISFQNERGTVHLSIRVSEMYLEKKHLRIIAVNDINEELDEKEIDSWIRLTRVLTHEIMNSITPITSLSDTLLSIHKNMNVDIHNGLDVISSTGKSLLAFVKSYRKFTHIPAPVPSLFYIGKFIDRMVKLAQHDNRFPSIHTHIEIRPENLIVYADENLITQVMLNLLKNAMQAIGEERTDGLIEIKAYCNDSEAILIEVSNNGPTIPPEEIEHIFVPFFTTKENGSGIGLSISRQIMRLSGGSIALKSNPVTQQTTFTLTFP